MNDRVKQFLRDIERNQYAVDAWGLVIRELQGKRIEEVRPVYENAVTVFPTAGRFWKLYIEHEVLHRYFLWINFFLSGPCEAVTFCTALLPTLKGIE